MTQPLHRLLAAVGATVVAIGTGVWITGDPQPESPPVTASTPLADYDTTTVAIARGPFCDRLAPSAVEDVLGTEPSEQDSWADGDELTGVGVVHEYGCRVTSGAPEGRAWVLAPPVTRDRARQLARAAAAESGCTARRDAPAYGVPSVALLCTGPHRTSASYRGLFGGAWLSCTLALPNGVPRQRLLDRAGRWCVAVADAARR